jgi:hypothetical protein
MKGYKPMVQTRKLSLAYEALATDIILSDYFRNYDFETVRINPVTGRFKANLATIIQRSQRRLNRRYSKGI